MVDIRRAGGRGLDREHEHGVGRQQEAVLELGRSDRYAGLHVHGVRSHGSHAGRPWPVSVTRTRSRPKRPKRRARPLQDF